MRLGRLLLSVLFLTVGRTGVSVERIVYHDGTEVAGEVVGVTPETIEFLTAVRTDDGEAPSVSRNIAIYELGAIQFSASATPRRGLEDAPEPILCFRSGQILAGRVTETRISAASNEPGRAQIDGARIDVPGTGSLDVPLELLSGFRLQRRHRSDALFREDLAAAQRASSRSSRADAPPRDWVYVVRGRQLLKVGGVFRALDEDYLSMEYKGKARRVPRSRVFGVILAPLATRHVDTGYPAVFRLTSGDEFPAILAGLRRKSGGRRELLVRFRGSDARQAVPGDRVQQVAFLSDRVVFLSDLAPLRTREVPLVGSTTGFPWRKDRSTAGGPIQLDGKTYRKGLGVHAYSSLEFDIGGRYATFAATIGLVDREPPASSGPTTPVAGVTFRVAADDKVLLETDLSADAPAQSILVPVTRVERLTLEVDFGKDGVDFGDHAAWAEARVIKD